MNYPKILIIGQPFNSTTGGGVTLTNLFRGWPKEKLAVICSGYVAKDINWEICDNYYQLGFKEHKWIFPFNLIQKNHFSGRMTPSRDGKPCHNKLSGKRDDLRSKFINNVFYPVLNDLGVYPAIFKTKLSEDLKKFIDEYEPDIIYSQASSRQGILFIRQLFSYLRKPLAFHMMDDWPALVGDGSILKAFWKRKVENEIMELLDKCSLLMSICDEMSKEYFLRYGKVFVPFHNPIDVDFWMSTNKARRNINNEIEVLYAGKISLGVESSLRVFAKSIDSYNKENNTRVRFVLQTNKCPSWISESKCLSHRPLAPYENLPRVFSNADFLLLPYDFDKRSIKYVKFSMPTKATEYMASGTPLIVFAPSDTSLVKYALQNQCAYVITSNHMNSIVQSLGVILSDLGLQWRISSTATLISRVNHDSQKVCKSFQGLLFSLSSQTF